MGQDLLENLNPAQREAVTHTEGPLLIFAGAGSGKTRVLVHRMAYLIQEKGVNPFQLFAVTFTNKAAGEMKDRISRLLGRRADDLWISTFHSAGVRILRRHAEKSGLAPFFTIFDDADQLSLIKEGLEILDINPKLFTPRAMMARINQAKNELVNAEQYADSAGDFFDEKVALLYAWYSRSLQKNNAVDFGDLLLLPVRLFEQHPDVLQEYQERLRYILVDEYQDTNHAQYRFIKLLSQSHQNLCVVGDDDQSIYRWRGANLRNILDFELDFSASHVIKLEQNYRSTQTVLRAAGEVVKKIGERRPKELWTQNEEGEPILHFTALSEKGEAAFVVKEIKAIVQKNNCAWNDCAVFYRTNAQSRAIEDELRRSNVPYIIVGGVRFYDRREIKDLLAYLYTVANPADSLHLKRIINVPARGIGKTTVEKLEAYAFQKGIGLMDALGQASDAGLGGKSLNEIKKFVSLVDFMKRGLGGQKLSDWVRRVLEQTGYLSELKLEKTLESEDRIENLKEFINVVTDYESRVPVATLEGFLDEITLASDIDQPGGRLGALPLMTLHMAKGLEFDYVFMIGLEEGLFPHTRSLDTPEEMDEERRLMYVGMTRTRKRLTLTHAQKRSVYGAEQYNLASRFLEDIPFELMKVQKEKTLHTSSALPFPSREPEAQSLPTDPYRIGRKVKHPIFGMGTIKTCEGVSQDRKLTILFQNGDQKRMLARLSNLQLM